MASHVCLGSLHLLRICNMSASPSIQDGTPRYARNNFPIEVVYDILPTLEDRDTERLREERTDKDNYRLLDIRYRHLDLPEPASSPFEPEPHVDLATVRPGRETAQPQWPQADFYWSSMEKPEESRADRLDGNIIRFQIQADGDGGSRYQEFVGNIAAEM